MRNLFFCYRRHRGAQQICMTQSMDMLICMRIYAYRHISISGQTTVSVISIVNSMVCLHGSFGQPTWSLFSIINYPLSLDSTTCKQTHYMLSVLLSHSAPSEAGLGCRSYLPSEDGSGCRTFRLILIAGGRYHSNR